MTHHDPKLVTRDEAVREKILDIITEWKHFWMNQTQNSKEDFENYRRRAWGIDANMKHHLADLIAKALQSPPPQQDDREARKNASQQWWDDFVSKNDNGYGIHARTIFELGWQAARAAQSLTDAQAMDRAEAVEKAYFDGVRQGEINARAAEGDVVRVKAAWKLDVEEKMRLQQEVFELKSRLLEPREFEAVVSVQRAREVAVRIAAQTQEPGTHVDALELQACLSSAGIAQSDVKERAEHARINLACLIPDPKNPKIESWPVDNPADAECLQIAYEALMAIKSAEGKNGC